MENNKMEINKDRILKVLEKNHSVNLFSSAIRNKVADELLDSLNGNDPGENISDENTTHDWSSKLLPLEEEYVMTTTPKEEQEEVDAIYAEIEENRLNKTSNQSVAPFGDKLRNKTDDPPMNVEKAAPRSTPPVKPEPESVKRRTDKTPMDNRSKPQTGSGSERPVRPVDGKKSRRDNKKAPPTKKSPSTGDKRGLKNLGQ